MIAKTFSTPDSILQQWMLANQNKVLWEQRLDQAGALPLSVFLEHAFKTVPFYRDLVEKQPGVARDLLRLPLVNKERVASQPSHFISNAFDPSTLRWKTTSGTTGIPLNIPRDPASAYGFLYDPYRLLMKRIPGLSEALRPGETAVVLVKDNPDRTPDTAVIPNLQHGIYHFVVLGKGRKTDEDMVHMLRGRRIPLLYGRPRSLLRLRDIDEEVPGDPIQAHTVLSSGDNLYDDTRNRIRSWFGGPVFNAYMSQEAGFLGVECHYHQGIHIQTERLGHEILTQEGELVQEGQGELIITNRENWAMPFIRYRTGDQVSVTRRQCPCGSERPTIEHIAGRDSIYFFFGSARFNPSRLNPILESLPIRQFQVIQQRDESLTIFWIPAKDCADFQFVEVSLVSRVRDLIPHAEVVIERVERIGVPGKKVQRFARVDELVSPTGGAR